VMTAPCPPALRRHEQLRGRGLRKRPILAFTRCGVLLLRSLASRAGRAVATRCLLLLLARATAAAAAAARLV
jgi:hypothetical protein